MDGNVLLLLLLLLVLLFCSYSGDQYLKPVISEPEVTVSERTDWDEFIVIPTDGLWDVFTNEAAYEVVRKLFDGQIKRRIPEEYNGSCSAEPAAMPAELAMARGSRDNISVDWSFWVVPFSLCFFRVLLFKEFLEGWNVLQNKISSDRIWSCRSDENGNSSRHKI